MSPVFLGIRFLASLQPFTFQCRARQTAQWWEAKQRLRVNRQVERVRDGLMQDLFTIRRRIELLDHQSDVDIHALLQQISTMHHDLEHLTEHLSPPYIEDSLPLAIQNLVEQQRQGLSLPINLDLPANWLHSSATQNHTIVLMLDELIYLTIQPKTTQSIHLALSTRTDQGIVQGLLTMSVMYANRDVCTAVQQSQEVAYLCRAFQLLTSGRCTQTRQDAVGQWQFRWRSPIWDNTTSTVEHYHE